MVTKSSIGALCTCLAVVSFNANATDKYSQTNQPVHPRGYAEPYRIPLFPQTRAEIMGGRIPLNKHQSKMPESLDQVVVGAFTAAEISWPTD